MNGTRSLVTVLLILLLSGCWQSKFQLFDTRNRIDVSIVGEWQPDKENDAAFSSDRIAIRRLAKGSYEMTETTSPSADDVNKARREGEDAPEPTVSTRLFESYKLPQTEYYILAFPGSKAWQYRLLSVSRNEIKLLDGRCETGVIEGFAGSGKSCFISTRQAIFEAAYGELARPDVWDSQSTRVSVMYRIR